MSIRSGRRGRAEGVAWALAAFPLLLHCAQPAATAAGTRAAGEAPLVTRRADFQPRLLLTGQLEAVEAAAITIPRTPAWQVPIRWIEADGTLVTEGQKVLELDNSQFTGDLEQKRLAEAGARTELERKRSEVRVSVGEKEYEVERARIELDKARLEAEVPAELRSRREHQEKQLALVRAQFEHTKAVEDMESTRRASAAELREMEIALERAATEIRTAEEAIHALSLAAPRDGIFVVTENEDEGRKYQVGDSVWVGLRVASIPDLSRMQVVARLFDVDDGRIAPGMRAACRLDTYPEQEIAGEVVEIAPVAQEDGEQSTRRAFRAVIRLAESDPQRMRPGMSVLAEVLPPAIPGALVAPRLGLDLREQASLALLADGSSVEVRLGPCNAMDCIVEDGLAEGTALRAGS